MKRITHGIPCRPECLAARKQPALSPLALWRTKKAETFNAATAVVMREAISTIAIIGEPMWRAAANGDAAAATGLALRLHPDRATPLAFDLVMTAVAACAAEGNATACLVMSRVVSRRRGAGKKEGRIATSWRVRTLASPPHPAREQPPRLPGRKHFVRSSFHHGDPR